MEKNSTQNPYRLAVVVLLVLAGSFAARAQNADIDLARGIRNHRYTQLDGTMRGISNSVYPVALALPIGQLAYKYITHDTATILSGWKTVAALSINTVATFGLKYAVNRARPYNAYPNVPRPDVWDNDPSFPSGHTSYAFTVATCLSLEYRKWYVVVPAYTWAGLAGYSRLHLGEHYPSDVLAGAIVGTGSAWLSYKGSEWLLHHRKKHTQAATVVR